MTFVVAISGFPDPVAHAIYRAHKVIEVAVGGLLVLWGVLVAVRVPALVEERSGWWAAGLGVATGLLFYHELDPTGMADHIEVSPPGHILTEPMPVAIQKHMLEHADGGGRPGVIINYNCVKFRCPEGMIERLASIARSYPFVYVAPFLDMDVKIAVTRLGKILILDDVDERQIREFIKG